SRRARHHALTLVPLTLRSPAFSLAAPHHSTSQLTSPPTLKHAQRHGCLRAMPAHCILCLHSTSPRGGHNCRAIWYTPLHARLRSFAATCIVPRSTPASSRALVLATAHLSRTR